MTQENEKKKRKRDASKRVRHIHDKMFDLQARINAQAAIIEKAKKALGEEVSSPETSRECIQLKYEIRDLKAKVELNEQIAASLTRHLVTAVKCLREIEKRSRNRDIQRRATSALKDMEDAGYKIEKVDKGDG